MRLLTVDDIEQRNSILRDNWEYVSDDYSDINNLYFDPERQISFIDDNFLATLYPITNTIADCHIVSKNPNTDKLMHECRDWVINNTTIRSLLAHVPINNERCKSMCDRLGFNLVGISPRSYMKNGELLDQYIYVRCL